MIRGGKMWDQTDGCVHKYMCSIAYYLMYFISKLNQNVLDTAVDAPGHEKMEWMALMLFINDT